MHPTILPRLVGVDSWDIASRPCCYDEQAQSKGSRVVYTGNKQPLEEGPETLRGDGHSSVASRTAFVSAIKPWQLSALDRVGDKGEVTAVLEGSVVCSDDV